MPSAENASSHGVTARVPTRENGSGRLRRCQRLDLLRLRVAVSEMGQFLRTWSYREECEEVES